jgi:hypothetical protein
MRLVQYRHLAYISIRQHAASIRQHTSAYRQASIVELRMRLVEGGQLAVAAIAPRLKHIPSRSLD